MAYSFPTIISCSYPASLLSPCPNKGIMMLLSSFPSQTWKDCNTIFRSGGRLRVQDHSKIWGSTQILTNSKWTSRSILPIYPFLVLVNPDTCRFPCDPCFQAKSLITEASDPLPLQFANLLICSKLAQQRAAPPVLLSMGTRPGSLLPFSFLLFHVPGPTGWSETLRAMYDGRKTTGFGVNQTWHKILPRPLLGTWPWENLISVHFFIAPNVSFCFSKMRIKPVHRAVSRNKQDEKGGGSNSEWRQPRMWLCN